VGSKKFVSLTFMVTW